MTIKEAVMQRHMVRKYIDKTISAETVKQLNERIEKSNTEYDISMKLVTGNADGIGGLAKLLLTRSVYNYIILAGKDHATLDEKLGYCGADLILYAQTLGLNTWWCGGMFSSKAARKQLQNGNEPQWFKDGVEALLCAPTALNKQPYMVTGDGNKVTLTAGDGHFAGIDLGIGKYHFEVGAGKENFEWV